MKPYILKANLRSPILLTCEHASARIPKNLDRLGLSSAELRGAKDLYDPGSEQLTRTLAESLGASMLLATTSRLVIDYNRRLDMQGVAGNGYHAPALKTELLTELEGIETIVPIVTNQKKSTRLAAVRYEQYVQPYQAAGLALAQRLVAKHGHCLVLSVHSFYPVYRGDVRKVDIDVLYDRAVTEGKRFAGVVKKQTSLVVAENKPWGMKDVDGGVFTSLQNRSDITLLAVDINNRLLQNRRAIQAMARVLVPAVRVHT
ncbi:MAG: N-formylglutamate amidohydrolase [Candidatus Doudnabacteria bacterium]|nr:N-formylglutamate amidohydrolase [Candidatus Doudnabacteria bacterium]